MTKYRRLRYLRQTSLIHFVYPEEPIFGGEPAYDELIDKSEPEYTYTTISNQHGTRNYRKKIT